ERLLAPSYFSERLLGWYDIQLRVRMAVGAALDPLIAYRAQLVPIHQGTVALALRAQPHTALSDVAGDSIEGCGKSMPTQSRHGTGDEVTERIIKRDHDATRG